MKRKVIGNLAMSFSKICSGLNQNALRYLQPAWMDAWTGVFLRLIFAGASFWIIGLFTGKRGKNITIKDKLCIFCIGFFLIYGYMLGLLFGLTYSSPVSTSLILCTEPVWVLIMAALFFHKPIQKREIAGIALGFAGCLICILSQKTSHLSSNPLLGNLCCLGGALLYSLYIISSKSLLKKADDITFNKWSFLGGALASMIGIAIHGFYAPVLYNGFFSLPMLVLLFVLVFPSTISYLLMTIGMENLSSTVVAMYGYVILIVSMSVSYILGQDKFTVYQAVAVILIVVSVYLVELCEQKSTRS